MKYIKLISHNLYKSDIYQTEDYEPFPANGRFIYIYMVKTTHMTKITTSASFRESIKFEEAISLN